MTIGIFSILIIFFVDTAGIYNIYKIPSPPYGLPGIIGGIGAGASVLVSILLLYVYDKQREIISEQKNLTEYQQTALLRVADHTPVEYQESKNYQEDNCASANLPDNLVLYQTEYLEVDISNIGLAPAHDLRVELYIETEDGRYTASLPMIAGEWKEVVSELYSNNKSSIFLNADGNAIASDSSVETHTVPLTVFTENIPEEWKKLFSLHKWPPANSVVRCAEKNGEGKTTVALLLWFKDGRGPQGPHYLRCVDVESDEFLFAKEAVQKDGEEYDDGADLREILDTGTSSQEDRIPNIEHPEIR
ncbi:hypothetical protein [Halobellus sp. H-GB7]|uniref:hypothetical protein n=1 Tax=Halobellus sp. H-GB7 TaxID=3069756 RepID=UPI0027B587AB|nr:hypothetical protein [Halobellus sp. H-GB7]MDQ2054126.1 hypothetical protein [Halobellus sp. H-GB7]